MIGWAFIYAVGAVIVGATVAQAREIKRLRPPQRAGLILTGALLWPVVLILVIAIKATDFIDKGKRP